MRALALLLAVNIVVAIDYQCDLQDSTSKIFPHDTDARKYYVCDENHKLIESVCPDESVFNKVLRICDKAESNSSGRSDCPNGSVKPDIDKTKFSICISNSWRTRECPNGHVFSSDKVACVRDLSPQNPTPPKEECKQGELKADATNPNKYFLCVNNVWRSYECPSGLVFNAEKRLCASKITNVTTNSRVTKDCKQGEFKVDGTDPNKYFVCVNNVWRSQVCPPGLVFNAAKRTCAYKITEDVTTNTKVTKDNCETGCVQQNPNCCDRFFLCVDGVWTSQSCQPGHYFNPNKRACVVDVFGLCKVATPKPPPGCTEDCVKQDPPNCRGYLICKNGVWEKRPCPDGLYFNPSKNACVVDVWGACIPQTQPPPTKCTEGYVKQDPECCDRYFICVGGEWKRESCPAGQYFEPSRLACIIDVNGVCTSATVAPQDCDGFPHASMKPDKVCNKFWLCMFGIWRPQSCDPGKMFDSEKNVCVPDDGTCVAKPPKCEEGCVKQDPECCDKYYVCSGGIWVRNSCPKGQYFDPSKNACVIDVWGACIPQTQPPPTKCTEGYVKQDPECCDRYFICVGGEWKRESCPAGQYFEPSRLACIIDVNGVCTSATVAPQDCDGFPHASMKPDKVCNKFWLCMFGVWRPQSCDPGKMFDSEKNVCVPDDGTCVAKPPKCEEGYVKQDPECCDKYYVCSGGIWVRNSCPKGQYFDPTKNACVVDVWGACIPQTQPPPTKCTEGYVKQDPECCDRYFICVGGEWKRESCPAGQYFEPSRLACIIDVNGVCTSATVAPQDCDGFPHASMKPDKVCNKFWLCMFGVWRPQSCDPGKMFDSEKNVCVPDDGTCVAKPPKCEEGYVKQDPECCDKYYVCSGGIWVRNSCPKGQYFDPTKNACVVDVWGACIPQTQPPPTKCTEGYVKQDPECCDRYFICVGGEWKRESCAAGQYFEPSRLACIIDVNGVCTSATVAPQDCDGFPHASMKPDKVCNKFWLCMFGVWRPQSCDPGKMFDSEKNVCVPDDGTCVAKPPKCEEGYVKQDPECCDKYYVCSGGIWVRNSCPKGQYFDPTKNACVVDVWGACIPQTQPPPTKCTEGYVKQDPECCDRYFICVGGEWKRESCPAGQYFEPSRLACIIDVNGVCTSATVAPQDCDGFPHASMKPDKVCNKFWLCMFGIWRPQSCDPGKMFDSEKNVCVPDDGTCVAKPPKCEEGYVKQDPECCDKYYVCSGGIWVRNSCPKGQYFDPTKNACVVDVWGACIPQTQPPPTKCTEGYVKQDPECCDRYFICVGGEWKRESCAAGQYFEPSRLACIIDVNGVCTSATVAPQDCDGFPHASMKPDKVCNKFWLCMFGIWRPQSCDPGKMFDSEKNVCVPDDGTCVAKPPKCEEGYVKQDPECCDKYYVCSGGIWVRNSCPKGQYFDPTKNACVVDVWGACIPQTQPPPTKCTEGYVKQDPECCDKYYVCSGGIWVRNSCPKGQYFDPSKNACVVDVWGACKTQTQPPPPTECTNGCVKQDPNCCDRYFSCVNGRWKRVSCPAGQYFDPKRQACIVDVLGLCKLRLGESQHRRM